MISIYSHVSICFLLLHNKVAILHPTEIEHWKIVWNDSANFS